MLEDRLVETDRLVLRQVGRGALEIARIGLAVTWQYLFLTRRVEVFEHTADEYARSTMPASLPQLGRMALRDRLRGFMEIRRHRWKNASLADAGSMVSYAALKALLTSGFPDAKFDANRDTMRARLLSKPYRLADLADAIRTALDRDDGEHRTEGR